MNSIVSGSLNHSCLRTFLEHAHATGLNPQSTVYLGTRYEYLVGRTLRRLGFSLVRVGRGGDGGVDLLGEWSLSAAARSQSSALDNYNDAQQSQQTICQSPIRVLLQCKRLSRRLTPEYVRELEGAFAGVPSGWRRPDNPAIGFLVTTNEASRGVIDAVQRSRMPMGFIALEERISDSSKNGTRQKGDDAHGMDGRVKQLLWNWRAQELGLQGVGVTWRHSDNASPSTPGNGTSSELTLTWNGKAVLGDLRLADNTLAAVQDMNSLQAAATQEQKRESLTASAEAPNKRGRPKKSKG